MQARAALFRAELAALPDWSDTVVVSHWGFILCLTGQSVMNGSGMRCDPQSSATGAARLARLTERRKLAMARCGHPCYPAPH